MARSMLTLNDEGIKTLADAIENYPGYAGNAINDVLWNDGGAIIQQNIMPFLPESGRTWRGKKPAAKRTAPFMQINDTLSVTVKSKNAYHYLYFPDDGSDTRHHAGNQGFMLRGAEVSQDEISARIVARLVQPFE